MKLYRDYPDKAHRFTWTALLRGHTCTRQRCHTAYAAPLSLTFPLASLIMCSTDGASVAYVIVGLVLHVVVIVVEQGTRLAALLPQDILETFRDKSSPGPRGKEVTKAAFDTGMQVNCPLPAWRGVAWPDECLSYCVVLLDGGRFDVVAGGFIRVHGEGELCRECHA